MAIPTTMNDSPKQDTLRVSVHEHEIQALMRQYPKLTRTEILDVISRSGPMRSAVEGALERLSDAKR